MFYRWSCDLAGELPPKHLGGNVYIMIMIEHFSKWIELVALPDKSSRSTSQAFLQQVLSRFGACAECLTDQGSEFRGEFQELLDTALIDHLERHRTTHKPMVLLNGWFKLARRDLRRFASPSTRRIGTWPCRILRWGTGCPNMPRCPTSLLTSFYLAGILFLPLPLLLKWN